MRNKIVELLSGQIDSMDKQSFGDPSEIGYGRFCFSML